MSDFSCSRSSSSSPTFDVHYGLPKVQEELDAAAAAAAAVDFQVDEDETSICVTMQMPGVKGGDISVSVQDNILTIQGHRRSVDGRKKQRLHRRIPVNTQVVDVTRAVANIWKDVLVLYAPKRQWKVSIPVTEEPEFEFVSPAVADLLKARDAATTE